MTEPDPSRAQLLAELAHWRDAVRALADLDTVAAPEAWGRLEGYLRVQLRARLTALVASLEAEAATLGASVNAGADTTTIRKNLLRLRFHPEPRAGRENGPRRSRRPFPTDPLLHDHGVQ